MAAGSPDPQAPEGVALVEVAAYSGPSPQADGVAQRLGMTYGTTRAADGAHDVLTDVQITMYTDAIGDDPVTMRRAARLLLAHAQGIAATSDQGSGFLPRFASRLDGLSVSDLTALRLMTGCTVGAGTSPTATVPDAASA